MTASRDAVLYDYLMRFVGTPYLYGGNVPGDGGLDCSGLVLIYLQAAGKWPHGADTTAQGLFDAMKTRSVLLGASSFGDLSFYGTPQEVGHVGVIVFGGPAPLMLEAGGGTETTTSPAEAAKRDALVRVRPVTYRKDYLGVCRP